MMYNDDLTFKDLDDQNIYEEMVLRVMPIIEGYLKTNFSNCETDLWITQRMVETDLNMVVSDVFMEINK